MTLAEWNAWAAANRPYPAQTLVAKVPSTSFGITHTNVTMRVSGALVEAGVMWGSPLGLGGRITQGSSIQRAIQHAMPSQAEWSALVAQGASAVVFINGVTMTGTGYTSYSAVNRNGYLSASYGSYAGGFITSVAYYSTILKYPVLGLGDSFARFIPFGVIHLLNNGVWKPTAASVLVGGEWKDITKVSAKV